VALGGIGANEGAGAVRSGRGAALDAVDAAPASRTRWRPFLVVADEPDAPTPPHRWEPARTTSPCANVSCVCLSTTTPYELRGERETTRGVILRNDVGVIVQGEHDGLEEGRSDPEGRGAHGPARPA